MSLLVLTAAVALGKTLFKSAVGAATGNATAGDAAGELAGVFGDKVVDQSANRKARRRISAVADTVGERVLGQFRYEFRSLSDEQRAVVVTAVDETFQRVPPAARLVIEEDFDPARLDARIRGLTDGYLAGRVFGEDETSLYRLLLRESCNAVVHLVRDTAGLADLAVPEVLGRLTALESQVREAPGLAIAAAQKRADDEFTRLYRDHVGAKLNVIDLYSDRLRAENRRYPLPPAYVSLPVAVRRPCENPVAMRIEDAIADRRRVVLRAHCGAGKTTHLYRWFALAASGGFTGALSSLNSSVPLYLPLDRYANGDPPDPAHFIEAVGRNISGTMPLGWIQRRLDDAASLVLINGLDEVPVDRRAKILDWIRELVGEFPRPAYVLATRPGVIDDDWPAAGGFDVVDLLAMGPADSMAFVRCWHEAAKAGLSSQEAHAEVDACAERLLAAIASCHALRALAKHPLTCALMCALHREGKFALPEQWIDLIQAVVEILVNERDRDRGVVDTLWLPAGQRIGVLQDLAYWMTTENVPTLKRDRVLERVQYKLEGARLAATREGHSGSADEVLDYLITRSGLIHATGDDLGFTSEILRGYLAACEAVSGGNIGSLIREAHMAERQHLMVMVAGRSRLAVAEELLTGLLEKAEQDAATRTRLHLLIRACLHTAPAVGQELRERIEACCSPKTPRTAVEVETLAAAGPLVVDMLASQPLDDVESVVASIHVAAHVGSEDVLPFLARLARDERPAVTEALRAAAAAFDTAEYERLVPVDLASETDPQVASTLVSGGGGTHG